MSLARTHRRILVLMAVASLLAFAGGAGLEPTAAVLAGAGLLLSFFWQPKVDAGSKLDRIWLPLALLLFLRILVHFLIIRDDIVIPVVDLLYLLLVAESLRPLETNNDSRLYTLSFALLLASTAYRPGLLFAFSFVLYVGLATVALMVGHLRRQGERHVTGEIPLPQGFLMTTAALSGVTLLFSVLVFLAFPRVSRGWAGRGEGLATSIAGFADEVTLGTHGSRIYGNPQIVLRVEFPGGVPADVQRLYWRGRSYDHFDGVRWSRSPRVPPSLTPAGWYDGWGGQVLEQRIYAAALNSRILFALHPTIDIDAHSAIQPISDNVGDLHYWGSASPAYTAWSIEGRPSEDLLRSASTDFVPARQFYLQLPPLSPEVRALSDSLLAEVPTPYEMARTLVDWFQNEFSYTLELPGSPGEATLDHFLFQRRAGHCEYFSTAMAVLLRSHGVPAREVNGFLGGEWSQFGDYLAVTQNQAHAWVEVWFQGYGWIPFDPTPSGIGGGLAEGAWFWPGRFLFDAVQHRWNKWVIDYSFQTQWGVFQRTRDVLSLEPGAGSPRAFGRGGDAFEGLLWWLLCLALAAVAVLVRLRRRAHLSHSSRAFLQLRKAGSRAGLPGEALHSPRSLTTYLQDVGHPAAEPAMEVVKRYLQDRFGGRSLRGLERDRMIEALLQARVALRKWPLRVPPGGKPGPRMSFRKSSHEGTPLSPPNSGRP